MYKNYFYIIFEGIDKSGKSTQIDLIYNYFIENYKDLNIIKTKEPGNTETGKVIRNILLKTEIDINILSEYYLFIADRFENIKFIKNNLNNNKINLILCDRSHFSTFSYQIYPLIYTNFFDYSIKNFIEGVNTIKNEKNKIKKIDKKIGKLIFNLLKPDLIFYFNKNNFNKDNFDDRIEKRKIEYFNIVLEGYKISFDYYYNFRNILKNVYFENGIDNNFNVIINEIEKRLNKFKFFHKRTFL